MRHPLFRLCLGLWLAAFAGLLPGLAPGAGGSAMAAPQRLALVIGNDSYANLPHLQKARNDADAVAAALGGMGFQVVLALDTDRRAMSRALSDLAGRITPGDEVLFYYAGHGVAVEGRNFLLPTDAPAARPGDEDFLTGESIAVDTVTDTLQRRGARITVLILDACRDNPFPTEGTRSAGLSRGLAPVTAPEGTFILFSAGAGQSALDRLGSDDANPNSVFTRVLLPLLHQPDLPVQDIARQLRADVEGLAASIRHKQRPAYYDELTGDFILASAQAPGTAAPIATPDTPPAISRPDPCLAAQVEWDMIGTTTDSALLRRFADRHGGCAALSRQAVSRLTDLQQLPQTASQVEDEAARSAEVADEPTEFIFAPDGRIAGVISPPVTPPPTKSPAVAANTWRVKRDVSEGYLNARSGPGTMHKILFRINAGTGGITVGECRRPDPGGGRFDWCLVTASGKTAWVSQNGIQRE